MHTTPRAALFLVTALLASAPTLASAGYSTITGQIFDRDGKPLANTTILTMPSAAIACTDSQGRYTMRVPSGTVYELTAIRTGWAPRSFRVSATRAGATRKGDTLLTRRNARTRQPRCANVSGRFTDQQRVLYGNVSDARGQALAGVHVRPQNTRKVATTDRFGNFTIILPTTPRAAHTLTVTFSRTGYQTTTTRVAIPRKPSARSASAIMRKTPQTGTNTSTTKTTKATKPRIRKKR